MFIAALSTIAKLWKKFKCPLTDEWIKIWHTYTTEYYSAVKKNEILSSATTNGARRYYAKQNKSVRERQISYDFTHMWNLRNKTDEHRGRE